MLGVLAESAVQKPDDSKLLHCTASVEKREWRPESPAVVIVTIESLAERPITVPLWSLLYLSADPENNLGVGRKLERARIVGIVDPGVLLPALRDPGSHLSWDGITARSLRVKLGHKYEESRISFDARNLIWDFEYVNRAPSLRLFTAAKPGRYDLQFSMTWETGTCESQQVPVEIISSSNKQKVR